MRRLIPAAIGALCLGLAVSTADGARKEKKKESASRGMLMPDLQAVLGDGWTVPPELSNRAQPGTILEVTDTGYRTVKTGCVAARPNINPLTNVSMQNSLSGGVEFGVGATQGVVSARQGMHLSFVGPEIISFELVEFIPSDDCVTALERYAQRSSTRGLVMVQEALLARVNGCEQKSATGRVGLPGASTGLAMGGACQMFSDAPVAVGVKTVALSNIPELADLGNASSAPRARAPSTPAPSRSAPAPSRSAPAPSRSSGTSAPKSKWATYPLRGHDNDMAAFGQVNVTRRSDGSLRIYIASQFQWSCGLDVDTNGTPTRLVRCASGLSGWAAVPSTIPLTCRVRTNDELCTGTYDLWANGRSIEPPAVIQISRARDPSASWPW